MNDWNVCGADQVLSLVINQTSIESRLACKIYHNTLSKKWFSSRFCRLPNKEISSSANEKQRESQSKRVLHLIASVCSIWKPTNLIGDEVGDCETHSRSAITVWRSSINKLNNCWNEFMTIGSCATRVSWYYIRNSKSLIYVGDVSYESWRI